MDLMSSCDAEDLTFRGREMQDGKDEQITDVNRGNKFRIPPLLLCQYVVGVGRSLA